MDAFTAALCSIDVQATVSQIDLCPSELATLPDAGHAWTEQERRTSGTSPLGFRPAFILKALPRRSFTISCLERSRICWRVAASGSFAPPHHASRNMPGRERSQREPAKSCQESPDIRLGLKSGSFTA